MAHSTVYPTLDELLSLLKRSSLPTIIVEGRQDIVVYRNLEGEFPDKSLSILAVGGRDTVLSVFERRSELPERVAVGFIADRDSWVVTGVPAAYEEPELILTYGYSVENDVFLDAELLLLLDSQQRDRFLEDLKLFLRWYALEFARYLAEAPSDISIHPNAILDDEAFREQHMELAPTEVFPDELFEVLADDYARLLRGKSLLGLLQRQLAKDYTTRGLLGLVAIKKGDIFNNLVASVAALVGAA